MVAEFTELKRIRLAHGWTYEEFAERVGVSRAQLWIYINRPATVPTERIAAKIQRYLATQMRRDLRAR